MKVRIALAASFGALLTIQAAITSDPDATKETQALYRFLHNWSEDAMLVGHQNSTLYGVYWKGDLNRTDIRDVTGSGPALYGWDLLEISPGQSSSYQQETLSRLRTEIIAAHERGAVNTVSWHMRNPVTNGKYDDLIPALPAALPGGNAHNAYLNMLDKAAHFFDSLVDKDGNKIPILFRPFHEMNGNWFWWHTGPVSEQANSLKTLWQFTASYFRTKRNLHHLLWVYAPSQFSGITEYLAAYPGDAYVDVLGLDNYQDFSDPSTVPQGIAQLEMITDLAAAKGKVAALTETGADTIPRSDWFTRCLLDPIANSAKARRISYCLFWRNADAAHFYTPPPRHPTSKDFIQFRHSPFTIFENDLANLPKIASGAALSRLWRTRTRPSWKIADAASPLFEGFDPSTQNARPVRADIQSSTTPPPISIVPNSFAWHTPKAIVPMLTAKSAHNSTLPTIIHGGNDSSVIEFLTNSAAAGAFSVLVQSVSLSGAALQIEIDETHARTQHYPVSEGNIEQNQSPDWVTGDVAVMVPPGPHRIRLTNPASGWFRISRVEYVVPPSAIDVYGVTGDTQTRLWLHNQTRAKDLSATFPVTDRSLTIYDLPAGQWTASFPNTAAPDQTIQTNSAGSIQLTLPTFQSDLGIILKKSRPDQR